MTVLELAKRWAEPPRILVVEDDPCSATAVIDLLSYYQCDVELVTTPGDALNTIALNAYAIMFIDANLASGAGLEVMWAFRAQSPDAPVLVLTGAKEWQLIEEIMDCGPVTVVRKPHDLTPQQLTSTLRMFKVHAAPRQCAA